MYPRNGKYRQSVTSFKETFIEDDIQGEQLSFERLSCVNLMSFEGS